MFYHPTCWGRTDIPPFGWYVRPSESLADGIAHKSRGQKGKLPFLRSTPVVAEPMSTGHRATFGVKS